VGRFKGKEEYGIKAVCPDQVEKAAFLGKKRVRQKTAFLMKKGKFRKKTGGTRGSSTGKK